MDSEEQRRSLHANFNAHDVEAVLAETTEEVDWPNAWQGGRVQGRGAVRAYWTRQWAEIDPHLEPVSITTLPDGRVAVDVRQVVRTLDGDVLSENQVVHVYEMRKGLVTRMTVEEPRSRA